MCVQKHAPNESESSERSGQKGRLDYECGRRLGYVAYALRLCVVYDKRQRSAHITGRRWATGGLRKCEMNVVFGAEFIITRIRRNLLLHSVYFFTFGSARNNTCCIQVERLRTTKWRIVLNRLWFFWNDKAHTSGEWNEMWFLQVKRGTVANGWNHSIYGMFIL